MEVRLNKPVIMCGSDGGDIYDEELSSLQQALRLIDGELTRLDIEIRAAGQEVPQMEQADYLAGLGFVACQRYIKSIAGLHKKSGRPWFDFGKRSASGATVVSLINAAANVWKHEAEWKLELDPMQADNEGRLWADIEEGSGDYKFANALYVLSPQGRFVGLVDLLKAWRDEFLATSPVYGPMISGTGKT